MFLILLWNTSRLTNKPPLNSIYSLFPIEWQNTFFLPLLSAWFIQIRIKVDAVRESVKGLKYFSSLDMVNFSCRDSYPSTRQPTEKAVLLFCFYIRYHTGFSYIWRKWYGRNALGLGRTKMFFLILHSFGVIIKLYQMNGMSWSLKHHSPFLHENFASSSVPSLDLSDHPELVAFEIWIGYESWKQFLWNIPNIFVDILWLCEAYLWSISQLAFICRRQMVV